MPRDSFKDFVLDQLHALGPVRHHAMFGGYGLYNAEDIFFGIIFKGQLYLKTDLATAPAYRQRGMNSFRPSAKQTLKNYYEVPVEILENEDQITEWARRAIACASREK